MKDEPVRNLLDENWVSGMYVAYPSKLKRPRQYAAQIFAERNKEKRRKMLFAVPDEYRLLVETHVKNAFALRKSNAIRFRN